jgi:hypothetical protein
MRINKKEKGSGAIEYEWVTVDNESSKDFNILTKKSFKEAKKHNLLITYIDVDWWNDNLMLMFFFEKLHDRIIPSIELSLQFQDWEYWNKPWSMSSFAKEFEVNVKKLGNEKFEYYQEDSDSMLNGFGVTYHPSNDNLKIKPEVENILGIIEKLVEITNKSLLNSLNSEVVLTYFQFPEEIKVACKQYLVLS